MSGTPSNTFDEVQGSTSSASATRKRPRISAASGVENQPNAATASAMAATPNNGSIRCTPLRNPYSTTKKKMKPPVRPLQEESTSKSEEDNDCLVVSPPPPRQLGQQQQDNENQDDVTMLESNLTNPVVDFIHARQHCGVFSFSGDKLKYCDKCYCMKCQKLARDCPQWEQHCHEVYRNKQKAEDNSDDSEVDVIDIEDTSPMRNPAAAAAARRVHNPINPAVQSYYARKNILNLLDENQRRVAENELLDADSDNDEWMDGDCDNDDWYFKMQERNKRRGGEGFDHHYSNEFNHAFGNGSGNRKGGRSPKDMKITEVLAQKLMDAIQLSEGGSNSSETDKDTQGNPYEKQTAEETFNSLNVQRKRRYDRSQMDGDISQLGMHKGFFVEGVRIGWPFPVIMMPQRQMAIHLIKALKNKRHVVLESPTGTGKSAAILCAVLAWQRYHAKTTWGKTIKMDRADSKARAKDAKNSDEGRGKIDELRRGEEAFPRIIYCSRTHSQVEQMVSSLKKTPYRPRMTVLGSRDRLCIHREINNRNPSNDVGQNKNKIRANVNTACQARVRNTEKMRKALWKSYDYHYDDDNPPETLPGDNASEHNNTNSQPQDEEDMDMEDGGQTSSQWILTKSTKKVTCPHYRQLTAARTAQMTRSNFIVNQQTVDCCTSGGDKTKLGVHDIEDLVSFGLNPYKEENIAIYRKTGEAEFGFELSEKTCRVKKIGNQGAAKSSNLLRIGDKVVAVNRRRLSNISDICNEIRESRDPLELTVLRLSSLSSTSQTERPKNKPQMEEIHLHVAHPYQKGFGLQLAGYDNQGKGCTVGVIKEAGAAESNGRVRVGDKIIAVNGTDVEDALLKDVVAEIQKTVSDPLELRIRHAYSSVSSFEEDVLLYRPKEVLGVHLENDALGCRVKGMTEGGLAQAGGLQTGDRIIAVGGKNVEMWSPEQVYREIKKNKNDTLEIRVQRPCSSSDTESELYENDENDEVDRYSPHSACPYYLSRALSKHAELIFAPYNYVLDPAIRSALDINLEGSVVVLDEAHNVEGVLTESGSGKFGEIELSNLISTLSYHSMAIRSSSNRITLKNGREDMDLSEVSHELLLFVEKVVLFMRELRKRFEASPGTKGAANAIEEYRRFKTPDDHEFELSYDGPNGHGVHRKPIGCEPFFDKLKISETDLSRLLEYSQAMETHLTGSNNEDAPATGNNTSDQGKNAAFDLLNGMISKFSMAAKTPEHFYISCVVQANGNLDFAAGLEAEEDGARARFKKKPKNLPYFYPRNPQNPHAILPVCGHKNCAPKGQATIGYNTGVRHGEWCSTNETPKWESHIVLKLLFPGLLMKDLSSRCRSVVLASGSLSPLPSLCAELDLHDETTSKTGRLQTKPKPLEADHVVTLAKQLLPVAIGRFPDGNPLTVTYSHYKNPEFFPRLGDAIASVIEMIPQGGVLVFVPSYGVLRKCVNCWNPYQDRRNGWRSFDSNDNSCPEIWERFLRSKGKVIVEPTGGQDKFEAARDEYRDTIKEEGSCILLAVFRGKMSEGISFNDDNARGVICVGIPFPGAKDRGIIAKKAYNDEQRKLKKRTNLLPGQEWYAQEAYRAIAQALGRCIRHAADYGTIVLMDSRHCNDGSPGFSHSKLPKWMRHEVRTLSMTDRGLGRNPVVGGYQGLSREMRAFFQQAPIYTKSKIEKMKLEFAKAKEREKGAAGHQFNSQTGSWTPHSNAAVSVKSVTQESPAPEISPMVTIPSNSRPSSSGSSSGSGSGSGVGILAGAAQPPKEEEKEAGY